MKIDRYHHFTVEDFVDDAYFRKWITDPSEQNEQFWKDFLASNPEKHEMLIEARNIILSIHHHFAQGVGNIGRKQASESYSMLEKKLLNPKVTGKKWFGWIAAASFLLGCLWVSTFWLNPQSKQVVYTTGHGKRIQLVLPDSSTVQLNANSQLKYDPDAWTNSDFRAVVLEGEAFFSVKRKSVGTKFIVKAGALNISVVGTEFNVRARKEKSQIVLAEGKVELAVADQQFDMEPGDMISYLNKERVVESTKVQALDYTAWKDGMTIFNNSLIEVAKELETLFGVQFVIDESLTNRKIQLSAPTDDLNQVLEILSLVYKDEIAISREAQQIFIKIPKK
jgi:ferric-dicitrate binding protein FerR (iron transport regulator)